MEDCEKKIIFGENGEKNYGKILIGENEEEYVVFPM